MFACLYVFTALVGCSVPNFGDSDAALALENLAVRFGTSRLASQTPQPDRHSVHYLTAEGERTGDLYRSPEGSRAGIVLVPGVVARGRHDPRLVAIASTLARLRFTVLVPDMPGVSSTRVRTSDVREVVAAFAWLVSRPDLAPPEHCGIAGFSYGAGPVLLAALQPDIRKQVRFILAVGGYYDIENVITYMTTGSPSAIDREVARGRARAGYRAPHPYTMGVFIRSNLEFITRSSDRGYLRNYAEYITGGNVLDEEPIPHALAPDAQSLLDLLTNHDPARVPELFNRLPDSMRTELDGINPATHELLRMQANVILLHGRGDNLIPYTESIALAEALPADKVQLFLIDGLAHVDLKPRSHDLAQLIRAMEALLVVRAP